MISGTFGFCYNIKFDSSLSSIAKKKLTVGEPRSEIWKKNKRTVPKIAKMIHRKKMLSSVPVQIGMKKVKKITKIS